MSSSGLSPAVTLSAGATQRAITLLAIAAFTSSTTMRIADAMLPELAATFAVTIAEVARVVSWYAIVYGSMQLVLGAVADRYGKFRVITIATCACSAGSLFSAATGTLDQLVLARVLTACAAAGIIPLSLAWIGDHIPYAQRQVTLARLASGTTLGITTGQLLGGVFVDTVGWRWAFVVLGVAFLLVGSMLVRAGRTQPHTVGGDGPAFLGQVLVLLRNRWALVVYGASVIECLVVFSVLALTPTYLHQELGLSAAAAGGAVAVFGLGAVLYTLVARRFVPAVGEVRLVLFGGLVIAAMLLALAVVRTAPLVALTSFVFGFGFYMVHNTLQTHTTQLSNAGRGTAVALFATLVFFGQAVGVMLGATLMPVVGARTLLVVCAVMMASLGALYALILARRRAGRGDA